MDEKYTGTWDSVSGFPDGAIPGTFPGLIPGVFSINADGMGKVLMLGNLTSRTYECFCADNAEKIKLVLPGVGECVFDVEINNGNLFLSNAAADKAGAASGLPIYALLSPFSKAAD